MISIRTGLGRGVWMAAWLAASGLLIPSALAAGSSAQEKQRSSPFGALPVQGPSGAGSRGAESEPSNVNSVDGESRFLEPVCLKHLSAKTAAEVFQGLCSPGGKVVAQEGSNNVLVMDTEENLARIVEEIKRADQALASVAMETVTLRFMDAKNLATVVTKMLTASGTVAASEAGNSLIVCDMPDNLEQVMRAIRKADQAPSQIVVEVVLLDVRLGDDTEIGVNWDYLATAPDKVGYRQNFTGLTDRLSMVPPTDDTIGQGIAYNTLGTAGELSIVVGNIRNVVHLIQSKRDAQVLASPRAMVVSGKKATIKAVEQIPYLVVTQSATGILQQTQFKEVGVTLDVTATLTDSGQILLDAVATQSVQTGTSVSGVPVVDTREGNTHLLLADRQTAVMGGLRRQQRVRQASQIPLLGDLPIVGALFRSTNDEVVNAELVVLLSPHVYQGDPVPDEIQSKIDRVNRETTVDEWVGGEGQTSGPSATQ